MMTACRHFNGYKPCGLSDNCTKSCPKLSTPSLRVLIVHLEALGAVVRSTALLPAIHRKFPGCHVTWITQKPADQILRGHPLVDRVLTTSSDDLLQLSALEFDVAFAIDKGLKTSGVLRHTQADLLFGFTVDAATGAVLPATEAAQELWEIGLSNQKKFFENKKPETQLIHEALELGSWQRDAYSLALSENEKRQAHDRKSQWLGTRQILVGINTGCSDVIPYKKLPVDVHREMIQRLAKDIRFRVVLLGGPEDTLRNERIAYGLDVGQSPTTRGLRDGMMSVAACDIVVTGDSLGMHLAIGLGKWTVAWFGPTCAHEIDLYDRGVRVLTAAPCSPCWKRSCDKERMCYDQVSMEELIAGVDTGFKVLQQELKTCPKTLIDRRCEQLNEQKPKSI